MIYDNDDEEIARVKGWFSPHPLRGDQSVRFSILREAGLDLAGKIMVSCPLSLERQLALRKLREAVMFALVAISDNEK